MQSQYKDVLSKISIVQIKALLIVPNPTCTTELMYTQYLATFQIVGGNSLLFCRAGWVDLQSLNESMDSQLALPVQEMEGSHITRKVISSHQQQMFQEVVQ